jgi:hypothetical protein
MLPTLSQPCDRCLYGSLVEKSEQTFLHLTSPISVVRAHTLISQRLQTLHPWTDTWCFQFDRIHRTFSFAGLKHVVTAVGSAAAHRSKVASCLSRFRLEPGEASDGDSSRAVPSLGSIVNVDIIVDTFATAEPIICHSPELVHQLQSQSQARPVQHSIQSHPRPDPPSAFPSPP